jgi:hypothetical protein
LNALANIVSTNHAGVCQRVPDILPTRMTPLFQRASRPQSKFEPHKQQRSSAAGNYNVVAAVIVPITWTEGHGETGKMMLRELHRVVARGVHYGDALERHVVDLAQRYRPVPPAEEL